MGSGAFVSTMTTANNSSNCADPSQGPKYSHICSSGCCDCCGGWNMMTAAPLFPPSVKTLRAFGIGLKRNSWGTLQSRRPKEVTHLCGP